VRGHTPWSEGDQDADEAWRRLGRLTAEQRAVVDEAVRRVARADRRGES